MSKQIIPTTQFGEWLSDMIDSTGLTRQEFAENIGVPSSTTRNHIAGRTKPDVFMLIVYSEKFHVSIDYMVDMFDDGVRQYVRQWIDHNDKLQKKGETK